MIPENIKKQIITIWNQYIANNKKVQDNKGNDFGDIDEKRIKAIGTLKIIIDDFLNAKIDLAEFKTNIDSFNKKNNFWGFTSIKGQMFFNLLFKASENKEQNKKLTQLLKESITQPKNLTDALNQIEALDKYTSAIFNKAPNKSKVPNPSSICYFLSYFWQIQDYEQWPVMYSSIITSFTNINLWPIPTSHKKAYHTFYNLNEAIKRILSDHTGRNINNWEAEHAFWIFNFTTNYAKQAEETKKEKTKEPPTETTVSALKIANFDIKDYLLPVISNLIELGNETENTNASKGNKFEKTVCEVFKQLGFNVQVLGQGKGREPDLIAIHKEENIAFIVDAKAYTSGYMMGTSDERAIKEYITHYCPRLQKEGIKKIGFLIISNAFKSEFKDFINQITWTTDIKRFALLTSDALLHFLAYKNKDQLALSEIIEAIISLGTSISAEDVIQKFDDI